MATKRERLEKKLAERLRLMVENSDIRVSITGALGSYRHTEADCRPWTGHIYIDGKALWDIGSWQTMTACLAGFDLEDQRGDSMLRRDGDFEVTAVGRRGQRR